MRALRPTAIQRQGKRAWRRFAVLAAATLGMQALAQQDCVLQAFEGHQQPRRITVWMGETVTFTATCGDATSPGFTNACLCPTNFGWHIYNDFGFDADIIGDGPHLVNFPFGSGPLPVFLAHSNRTATLTITNVSFNLLAVSCHVLSPCYEAWSANGALKVVLPLTLENVRRTGPNEDRFVFDFTADSNTTYTVQHRAAFDSGSWSNVLNIQAQSTNRVISVTNAILPGASSGFYRLAFPSLP